MDLIEPNLVGREGFEGASVDGLANSAAAAPETTSALEWLVRVAGFVALPSAAEDRLELVRWWTGGWADRLILWAEADAELQRFAEVDPRRPVPGRLVRRDRLTVVEVAAVVRAWAAPSVFSCPMRVSSTDRAAGAVLGTADSMARMPVRGGAHERR